MYKKISRLTLAAVAIVTLICGYFISTLSFNYDFESFFDKGDEDFAFYDDFRKKFGDDNDYVLIGIENDEGIFDLPFLIDIDFLTNDLKKVPYVEGVISPTNIKNQIISRYAISAFPFIHIDEPERISSDSAVIYSYNDLIGTFFSQDGKAITMLVSTEHLTGTEVSSEFIEALNAAIAKYDFDEVHTAGKAVAEVVYVDKMKIELAIFISVSFVLIVIFLIIAFRTAWGVLLPLLVVFLSVFWSLGFMGVMNKPIDIMTVLLPSIMFVVGMSDVVHIVTKYLDELRYGRNKIDAVKTTFREVGLATLLTSITTALGFITLITVEIKPVQDFGLFTAVGVMLAFILAFLVLPASLILMKRPKVSMSKNNDLFWYKKLHRLFGWILRNKKGILIGSVFLTAFSLYGLSKIEVDAKLIDEVKDGDPLKDDFIFFEEVFSGARPFELAVSLKDTNKSVFDYEVIQELNKIQNHLEREYKVDQLVSPIAVVRAMNRAMNGTRPEYYTVPETEREYKKVKRILTRIRKSEQLNQVVTPDWNYARFGGNMHDAGLKEVERRKNNFIEFAATELDTTLLDVTVTGSSLLIDKSNKSLSTNMVQGLCLAFIVIAIIMAVLYKSFKIIIIALIPNVIPLLMIAAIIGYFGVGLKISTAIIFTIAFGIAVDDTIHFMSKLKLELSKGKSLIYAIKRTFISTGKAIIVTSCILVAGFLTLVLSGFKGTFYTGLFVSLTLLFAVFADLILIPVLLMYFFKESKMKK